MVSTLLADTYADLRAMEADIARAAIDWTIVRPPRLTKGPLTGKCRTAVGANVPRGYLISRADVAQLMLTAINDPAMVARPVGIAY